MANEWRSVIAALTNPDARQVYAEVVLGLPDAAGLSPKKRERAAATLRSAGLVRLARDGSLELATGALTAMLEAAAEPRREGIDRFVMNGHIDTYPARPTDRRDLLEWVAARAVQAGEVLTEPELGERLEPFHSDVATLRRYLVDEGLLLRTPAGTSYSRA